MQLCLGEEEVDEPRTGDLDLAHQARRQLERRDQSLSHLARLLLERLREEQGEVRGRVAVRGVAWRLQPELGERGRTDLPRRTSKRFRQTLVRLHLSPESFFFLAPSVGFDSAGFGSAGFASPSDFFCASPARL